MKSASSLPMVSLLLAHAMCLPAQPATGGTLSAKTVNPPRNNYLSAAPVLVAAGDLNGDGRDEVAAWDAGQRKLSVLDYSAGEARVITATTIEGQPTSLAIADVDGDGAGEILLGEGLPSSDPSDAMKTEARLSIYRPLSPSGWMPEEVFRGPTARPVIGDLRVVDFAGDGQRRILFRYFASRYDNIITEAKRSPAGWQIEQLAGIRMATSLTAGRLGEEARSQIIVGRLYGDPSAERQALGDAFVLKGQRREMLPVQGGVSAIAHAHVRDPNSPDIVVADGWHSDYGRQARARVAIMRQVQGEWEYELIEDIPDFIRVREILPTDVDGDGKDEIIALAEGRMTKPSLVRLYQHHASGWRGTTLFEGAGSFAVANLAGNRDRALVLASRGAVPQERSLDLRRISWDAELAPERPVMSVAEPKALIGSLLPQLAFTAVDGRKVDLLEMRGKVVLVDFWATWCAPCVAELPNVKQVYEAYHDKGFEVVGISLENARLAPGDTDEQRTAKMKKAKEVLANFAAKHELPWPQYFDGKWWKNDISTRFGIVSIPAMFLIDQNGNLVTTEARGQKLEAEVKRLLKL